MEYEENKKSRFFWNPRKKSCRTVACWHYAEGFCKYGDRCTFIHDGPLTRKGNSRVRRNRSRKSSRTLASSSYTKDDDESVVYEETDRKEATRKMRKRAGTLTNHEEWKRTMQRTALVKAKVEADEKLHHRVRRNDTCMMMRSSQDSSCIVTETKMARNDASSFGLEESPPIKENGDSENHQ